LELGAQQARRCRFWKWWSRWEADLPGHLLDISLQKQVDKASPNLAKACATGEHFREAELAAQRGAGRKLPDLIVIKLSDVTITGFLQGVEDVGSLPSDSFSIRFTKIDYSYTLQKADGSAGSPVRWTWDLKTNKSF
jgi:type VI secretion system secreted protein Hcp